MHNLTEAGLVRVAKMALLCIPSHRRTSPSTCVQGKRLDEGYGGSDRRPARLPPRQARPRGEGLAPPLKAIHALRPRPPEAPRRRKRVQQRLGRKRWFQWQLRGGGSRG